jgi:hypothetical protein
MHTDSGHPIQRKFSWWLLGRIAVAASAVVCWFLLSRNNPARPAPAPSKPAALAFSTSQAAEDRDHLGRPREKLSTSPGDTLAVLKELARSQPEKAIELADRLGRTDAEKAAWIRTILKQWADRNPEKAWAWVVRPNNSLANSSLLTVVMDSMATSDPEILVGEITAAIVVDDKSGNLLAAPNITSLGLLAMVRSGNLDLAKAAVEAWANDPSMPKIGEAAYDIVAMAMDKTTPEVTADWLRSLPASDGRNSALTSLATTWAGSDPSAAMHWAESLTADESQSAAVSQIFSEWMQNNPSAAMNWLDDYIPRTAGIVEDDTLIGSMILFSPITKSDPGEAMKLADAIANPQTRLVYQQQLVQSWGRTDPGAAVEYVLNSTTIDRDQKLLLIQEIQDAYKAVTTPNPPEQ